MRRQKNTNKNEIYVLISLGQKWGVTYTFTMQSKFFKESKLYKGNENLKSNGGL